LFARCNQSLGRSPNSNRLQLGPLPLKNIDDKSKSGFHRRMKTATIGLTVAFCFLAGTACLAADPLMGTWKLNEAKSKFTPGTAKFNTVTFKSMLGNIKVTQDGIDANGKPMHVEWSGKFDGKDYAATGDPNADTRSYRKVDDRTLELTVKKNGKVTVTGRTVVSGDGKSRTSTVSGTTPKGKKFKNVVVYDKQA
jgi:hypothetical protein